VPEFGKKVAEGVPLFLEILLFSGDTMQAKNDLDPFSCFDKIPACDRQTEDHS